MAVASALQILLCLFGTAAATADSLCDADADHASTILLQTRLALDEHTDSPSSHQVVSSRGVFLAAARNVRLYPGLPANWSNGVPSELPELAPFNASAPIRLFSYHKTGHDFTSGYAQLRNSWTGENVTDCWGENYWSWDGDWDGGYCEGCWSECMVAPLMVIPGRSAKQFSLAKASVSPTVHWIRDPIHMLLSAYRYHVSGGEPWEFELAQPLHAEDDNITLGWIFQSCSNNCSYFEVLSSLNATDGALIEALNMRSEIATMLDHIMVTAEMPYVLHLSMEHLSTNFNETMACMNRFLGNAGLSDQQLPLLTSLDVAHRPPPQNKFDRAHVTSGKYDDTPLEHFLLSEPVWGAELSEARKVVRKVFERQMHRWGCPIPEI
jgi:hypothetical protein